ncbi:nucleotidyltransferase family protein [Micromonospora sp. CA-240977]|uniref:nucleotidyltransferase family protein n=1 Tax=Micromonospora sp. CA-240977 TaxID=3239957 RepID=UPI003D8D69FD
MRDVDVAFLDPTDLSRDNDDQATWRLVAAWSNPPWEAKKHATVHAWCPATDRRRPGAPSRTIADVVAT